MTQKLLHNMLSIDIFRLFILECNNEVSKLLKLISEAYIKAVFVDLNKIRFCYSCISCEENTSSLRKQSNRDEISSYTWEAAFPKQYQTDPGLVENF